tara:strand:- start:1210 stop:2559 length:1350 start_codon:yes stop_codon:yes gene_type:complete
MLKDIIQDSKLEINKKTENSILYFGTILYLTLIVSIYGSLHHINAISSSLCLITIALAYFNKKKESKIKYNLSAITAAISISIRPYYLFNMMIIPIWLNLRERRFTINNKEGNGNIAYLKYTKNQLNWIIILLFYIIIFNLTPYILKGNLSDFVYGIKLNSVDYIKHNIFYRQYINIGRNPILYPILLGMILLPIIRIVFSKLIYTYYQKKEKSLSKLYKLDIDLVFFGVINPTLLEIMFYRKHFFGHYFTLFSPYILISIVILLAVITRISKLIHNFHIIKISIRSISMILLIVCLITNQSVINALNEVFSKKVSTKSYKVKLIKDFIDKEKVENESFNFLAPENNYIHWKLDQSRHGFPQKAVFRNISQGKIDDIINKNSKLNYKFLLPSKKQLCETLNKNAPQYIITKNNDYSFRCLTQNSSQYNLLSKTKKLNKNNIFIFKRIYE